jgi:hypothetical protein
MPEEPSHQPSHVTPEASVLVSEERARFRRRVRKVSILVVLIVVGAHLLVGFGAAVWVVARYFEKPKAQFTAVNQVEMKPEETKHRLAMAKVESMQQKKVYNNRIQSLKPSALVLPELPNIPVDTAVPIDTSTVQTTNLEGTGVGTTGNGTGTGSDFFGGSGKAGSGLLEGTFYDLKQTKDGQDSKMDVKKYAEEMGRLAARGPSILGKYFAAPVKLYLPHLSIPEISADDAPKAFKVEDKVRPKMWVAVYEGTLIAPETGRFKFDGYCDDILYVWVNRHLVLDGSLQKSTDMGDADRGKRKTPEITMQKGNRYNVQIAIGEMPGGVFYAWLQLKNAKKDKPYWFRVTSAPVNWDRGKKLPQPNSDPPDADENGPVFLPATVGKSASSISGVGL